MTLTTIERKTLARLLYLAADEFGNHGCNEFEIPLTREAVGMVIAAYNDPEYVPLTHKGKIIADDSILMDYFAARLEAGAQ